MWDAVSGGEQIQSIALQGSGGIPTNQIDTVSVPEKDPFDFDYDAAGNVTADDLSEHTYSYDSENRLVSVDGGSTASYAYDHQNRRYKKTVGSTVTHYVWQGAQVLAEHNGSTGAVLWDYVFVGSRMIGKVTGSTVNYFLSDRLSVRLTMSSNGTVLGRQAYLPFGEDFAESGTQDKHHFTSYERDSESGLDYAINRGYSPGIARFQSSDPYRASGGVGDPQGWNRYSYSRNDSINRIDPLGLFSTIYVPPFAAPSTMEVPAGPTTISSVAGGPIVIEHGGGPGTGGEGGVEETLPPDCGEYGDAVLDISGKLLDLVLNISPISKGILEFATHAKTGEVDPEGSRLIETMTGQLDRFLYNPHLYATPTLRPNQLRASFSELSNRIVGYLHPPGIIPFPPLGEIPNQIGQIAAIKLGGFQSLTEALARLTTVSAPNRKRSASTFTTTESQECAILSFHSSKDCGGWRLKFNYKLADFPLSQRRVPSNQ
jgi:RHS repeat-associated protein